MKKYIFLLIAAAFALQSHAAKISYSTQNEIIFSETTEWGDIDISFKKCMANELFTFYYVKLNGKILNQTGSDNIGPFLAGGAWMGGNHPHASFKSANTLSVEAIVNNIELQPGETANADMLTIKVKNELLYADNKLFAYEYMTYYVSGNSIEVIGEHTYEHETSLNVDRYYGMQSMFVDETEILTPGGPNGLWQKITNKSGDTYKIDIIKSQAPNFCTFIEHNNDGFQAAYMIPEDLGTREWVTSSNDIVYTGNNWGKSYHKIIGNKNVVKGMNSRWHGIYSWFDEPIIDNCRNAGQNLTFEYGATIKGEPVVMHLEANGSMVQKTSGIEEVVVDNDVPAVYYNLNGVRVDNPERGFYVVKRGDSTSKIIVK